MVQKTRLSRAGVHDTYATPEHNPVKHWIWGRRARTADSGHSRAAWHSGGQHAAQLVEALAPALVHAVQPFGGKVRQRLGGGGHLHQRAIGMVGEGDGGQSVYDARAVR